MPKTLLLADDSVVIQKLVGLSFANEDVELVTTDNGDDALARAKQLRPDLVLADVVMPGKNGYEVCQAIKEDPELSTTPVLLLTGTFEAFDEDRARQVGSDGHITKPFEAQGLVDRVTDLLSQPRPAAAPVAAPEAQPVAAAPAPSLAPSAAEGDDAYDFFDDDVQELAAPEMPAPAVAVGPDDAFEFAGDLDALSTTSPGGEPETLDTNFDLDPAAPDDLTIAVAPPTLAVDADAPDATRVDMGETMIAEDFGAPTPAPVASLDATLEAPVYKTPAATPAPLHEPPPMPAADPAETMLADDLFADPATHTPPPVPEAVAVAPPVAQPPPLAEPSMPPALDSGFEFGEEEPAVNAAPMMPEPMPEAPAMASPPPFPAHVGEDITAPSPEPQLEAEPMRVADDPLAGMDTPAWETPSAEAPDLDLEPASWATPRAEDPALDEAAESTQSGYDVSASDLGDPLEVETAMPDAEVTAEPTPAPDLLAAHSPPPLPMPSASLAAEPIALATDAPTGAPEISPMMRDQIHETLEKVAWEAFADVSDTIVKQVLQRVESVVWEVVPQMAEALIQEEIRRMKGED